MNILRTMEQFAARKERACNEVGSVFARLLEVGKFRSKVFNRTFYYLE